MRNVLYTILCIDVVSKCVYNNVYKVHSGLSAIYYFDQLKTGGRTPSLVVWFRLEHYNCFKSVLKKRHFYIF